MNTGAGQRRHAVASPDADGLDRRDAHQGLGEPAIELAIPLDVAAETWRHAVREDLEGPAHRIAGVAGAIDLGDHPAFDLACRRSAAATRR